MLFGHQIVHVVGVVAIVLDVVVFKCLLGLPYLRLPLVVAVAAYLMNFYLRTSDFYSESTAKQLEKRCPGSIRRYKSDLLYFIESTLAVVILLVPVTALLITMWLNQLELYHVSFITQCIIAGVGYLFLHLISVVYEIGPTHLIGYSAAAQMATRTAAARKTRDEERYNEAKYVIDQFLMDKLGFKKEDLTPTTSLNALALDEMDILDLLTTYDRYLSNVYGAKGQPTEPPYGVIPGEKMRRYDALRLSSIPVDREQTSEEIFLFNRRFVEIFPLLQDQYEFLSGLILYYRK